VIPEAVGPLAPGVSLRDGRYRFERLLGVGGMATVWLAHDETLGRPVAVKVIADTLAADRSWVRRFEREARAAASLNHPHVVPVYDYGTEGGRPFLVMQYIPGGTLDARRRYGGLDVDALARDLLDALSHIHAAGLVHRDIKPANVLLDEDGRPLITDFGIAQPRDATSLTRTGNVLGTAPYLAPEVLAGAPATTRSDLFSCGRLLGQVADACPEGSGRLGELIHALTAADPARRPKSALAALELLDDDATASRQARTAGAPAGGDGRPAGVFRPTAVTRAVSRPGARPGPRAAAPRASSVRMSSLRVRRVAAVAMIVTVAVIILAILLTSSGSTPRPPAAASPHAPLQQQLKALQERLNYATRR
jgi:serine/threonine protein kinase